MTDAANGRAARSNALDPPPGSTAPLERGNPIAMRLTAEALTRLAFWAAAILLGFMQTWSSRMTLANDVVSFLDMGDLIMRGQWDLVVNGYWNPLFAAILGVTLALLKPSPYWEFPVVHFVIFAIFIATMGCFDFFMRELIALRRRSEEGDALRVPGWVWLTIGYSLFLWSSLAMIGVFETNPDMLVAGFYFAACALLVRVRRGAAGWKSYVALGAILGLGYLTKAIMFPLAAVTLAVVVILDWSARRGFARWVTALAVFLALTVPFITALSISKGKFTFGENGTYNYFVDIGHAPLTHWQGDDTRYGPLLHPMRPLVDHPQTYSFPGPAGVTYPVWYDPSYWYAGPKPDYDLKAMLPVVNMNIRREIAVLMTAFNGAIVASLFLLFCTAGDGRRLARGLGRMWFLLTPVIAAFGLYVLLHVDTRYVGPFFVVGLLSLYVSVPMRQAPEGNRLFGAAAILLVVMFLSPIGVGTIPKNSSALKSFITEPLAAERNENAEVVAELKRLGLREGDPIASVEYSNCAAVTDNGCEAVVLWGRLGRFKIVSEVYYSPVKPDTKNDSFWNAAPAQQERVLGALSSAGARLAASWQEPRGPSASEWRRIGNTHWYLRWLEPGHGQAG